MIITVYNYWIVSNQVYFKLHIGYETTYAQSVILVSHIQSLDEYTYDKDIILVGRPNIPKGIPELNNIPIPYASGPGLFGSYAYPRFLVNFMNFTQNTVYLPDGATSIEDDIVAQIISELPIYPDSGSIVIIDDKIYVRFQ